MGRRARAPAGPRARPSAAAPSTGPPPPEAAARSDPTTGGARPAAGGYIRDARHFDPESEGADGWSPWSGTEGVDEEGIPLGEHEEIQVESEESEEEEAEEGRRADESAESEDDQPVARDRHSGAKRARAMAEQYCRDILDVALPALEALRGKLKRRVPIAPSMVKDLILLANLAESDVMVPVDMRGVGVDDDDIEQMLSELGAQSAALKFVQARDFFTKNPTGELPQNRPKSMTVAEWRGYLAAIETDSEADDTAGASRRRRQTRGRGSASGGGKGGSRTTGAWRGVHLRNNIRWHLRQIRQLLDAHSEDSPSEAEAGRTTTVPPTPLAAENHRKVSALLASPAARAVEGSAAASSTGDSSTPAGTPLTRAAAADDSAGGGEDCGGEEGAANLN